MQQHITSKKDANPCTFTKKGVRFKKIKLKNMREKVLLKANFELVIKQSKYLKTFANDNTTSPLRHRRKIH